MSSVGNRLTGGKCPIVIDFFVRITSPLHP